MISCSFWTFDHGICLTLVVAFGAITSSSHYIPAPSPSYPTGYQQPNVYHSYTQTVPVGYTQGQVVQQPGVGITNVVSSQNCYDTQTGQVFKVLRQSQVVQKQVPVVSSGYQYPSSYQQHLPSPMV